MEKVAVERAEEHIHYAPTWLNTWKKALSK